MASSGNGGINKGINIQRHGSVNTFDHLNAALAGLPHFNPKKSQIFKDVELFYDLDPNYTIDDAPQSQTLTEIEYFQEDQ